jgi:hypothetical protein
MIVLIAGHAALKRKEGRFPIAQEYRGAHAPPRAAIGALANRSGRFMETGRRYCQ